MSIALHELELVILFGGPSTESDISLDSARTLYDAIRADLDPELVTLVYVSPTFSLHQLPSRWVYSNTIGDFFDPTANEPYPHASDITPLDTDAFQQLADHASVIAPMLHGVGGEDGQLHRGLLHGHGYKLIGSLAGALAATFDKPSTYDWLKSHGYAYPEHAVVTPKFPTTQLDEVPADAEGYRVVKPAGAGSSDGVAIVKEPDLQQAIDQAAVYDHQILIERRIHGTEFSLIVLQDTDGSAHALLPTEIAIKQNPAHTGPDAFYSRLRKYMPGTGATHHTPARLPSNVMDQLRTEGEAIFTGIGLRDVARLDGFVEDGRIIWTDLNAMPGYGVDALLFQQTTLFGLSQRAVSIHLLACAMHRQGKTLNYKPRPSGARRVAVLGGGATSEKHVSRMSWLNVTNKLESTARYAVRRVFVDGNGAYWDVGRHIALFHTVDEIAEAVHDPSAYRRAIAQAEQLAADWTPGLRALREPMLAAPVPISLEVLARESDAVFIALHGGHGEDGSLQRELEQLDAAYNGSGPEASALCMDKHATARQLDALGLDGFTAPQQALIDLHELRDRCASEMGGSALGQLVAAVTHRGLAEAIARPIYADFCDALQPTLARLREQLNTERFVLKPQADGCSSGVLVADDPTTQVPVHLLALWAGLREYPRGLVEQRLLTDFSEVTLRLPEGTADRLLAEAFIDTRPGSDTLEMTVAVLGPRGAMRSLYPSETTTAFGSLTVEEKFCKGFGVNRTPPPGLGDAVLDRIRSRIEAFANAIGLEGYARIDVFYNTTRDALTLIEVNTLPGLSPATVTFTQAAVTPDIALPPAELLGRIVEFGIEARRQRQG
ncbi:MAG: hypothetical protein AAF797_12780 [Planctomycetota bacterium]